MSEIRGNRTKFLFFSSIPCYDLKDYGNMENIFQDICNECKKNKKVTIEIGGL